MSLADFLSELGRRRVGRVAAAYAITAWALIQVADVVLPRLGFPDSTVTLLIVIAIAGFPVALALAWFYDVVPDAGADAAAARAARPTPRWAAAAAVVAVLVIAAGITARVWPGLMEESARIESIAVLPFENLSSDAEQEYFVAGMHDALITELAQIGSVRVLSRKSTLRYEDSEQSVADIARELGVDGVIEGSVLKVGGDMQMQVQLIRAQPSEAHVWAESYDAHIEEARRLHGEIARTVAAEIRLRLTPQEEARLTHERKMDPRAYEAYLRGMYFLSRQTPDDYRLGLRHLQEAVELDPADPNAYAGLALGYAVIGHGTIPDAFERAKAAARRALELDSTVAAAHEAMAEIALYRDWDYDAAERGFRKALALNPNLPEGSAHYGWLLALRGRDEDALAWMRRATTLDPLNPLWQAWVGWLHLNFEAYDSALAEARLALELGPAHPHALFVAGVAAARLGHTEEAALRAERLEAIAPFRWGAAFIHAALGHDDAAAEMAADLANSAGPMTSFGLALVHTELGRTETALDWLERAADLRFSWIPWIHRDENLTPLRGHDRFEALLRRAGLSTAPLPLGV